MRTDFGVKCAAFLKEHRSGLLVAALIAANLLYMHLNVGIMDSFKVMRVLTFVCVDVTFLTFLCYLLCLCHRKPAYCVAFGLSLLWSITNVIYSRFFGSYFNYHAVVCVHNLAEGSVINGIRMSFKFRDLVWLITTGCFVFLMIRYRKPSADHRLRYCLFGLLIPVFLTAFDEAGTEIRHKEYVFTELEKYRVEQISYQADNRDRYCLVYGVFYGQLLTDFFTRTRHEAITAEERAEIDAFASSLREKNAIGENACGAGRNLIFILVESYLAYTSDLVVDGWEVTPNLNSLRHAEGTYYNGRMRSLADAGESFDGQFIYMTGLLPYRKMITTPDVLLMEKIPTALPALLSSGPLNTSGISIPTRADIWNQDKLVDVYGFKEFSFFDGISMGEVTDRELFDSAIETDRKLARDGRYMHLVLTMSMHSPYDGNPLAQKLRKESGPADTRAYSAEFLNYLALCHYTDGCIGDYLRALKDSGLYDDSIILVTADHQAHDYLLNCDKSSIGDNMLPLIIANAPFDLEKCHYGPISQADVFTTLLDIYGIDSSWQGFGCSILDSSRYEDRITDKTYSLSKLMISKNYFRDADE